MEKINKNNLKTGIGVLMRYLGKYKRETTILRLSALFLQLETVSCHLLPESFLIPFWFQA
jgi:hypothetical protein